MWHVSIIQISLIKSCLLCFTESQKVPFSAKFTILDDSGYPHDGCADKNPYPHDRRADNDSYPHEGNNQCTILRLELSFVMINVQLMLV